MRRFHPAFIVLCLLISFFLPANVFALSSARVIDGINEARAAEGLPPLTENRALTSSAKLKIAELMKKGALVHTSSPAGSAWPVLVQGGYTYIHAGENLAVNIESEQEIVDEWIDSPLHKKNMVDPRFTDVGVAIGQGFYKGRKSYYGVAYFGEPKAKPIRPPVSISFNSRHSDEKALLKEIINLLEKYLTMLEKSA